MSHNPTNNGATHQPATRSALLLLETLKLFDESDEATLAERWTNADTRGIVNLMIREGGELWLYRRLSQLGVTKTELTKTSFWMQLERLARKTVAQNLLVRSHAERVIELLHNEGIPAVPIKGLARIALADEFPYADCRATNDVDVLVPKDQREAAWRALTKRGYRQSSDRTPEGHYHLPPLADYSRIPVELHSSTSGAVASEEAWLRAQSPGDPTELLWQGWMHGMDQGLEAFFLRYFLDAAVALIEPGGIDWEKIVQRLNSFETENPTQAITWLRVAAFLSGVKLPEEIEQVGESFPLHRTYTWRIKAYRSPVRNRSWTRKLLAEALRCEFDMGIEGPVPATPAVYQARRQISAAAARMVYRVWRITNREEISV